MRQGSEFQFGGDYIVFLPNQGSPNPRYVRTGLTDLDYSEIVSGLTEGDSVLVLPSASLVQSQTEARERFQRMTGGSAVPGMSQGATGTTSRPQTGTGGQGSGGGGRPPGS
jgi:hypothetical protein